MGYCSNCGKGINKTARYCKHCGEPRNMEEDFHKAIPHKKTNYELPEYFPKVISPQKTKSEQMEYKLLYPPAVKYSPAIQTNPDKSSSFLKLLKIIALLIILLVIFWFVSNLISNSGNFRGETTTTDKWWGTTHSETTYGGNGKEVHAYDCPFWNRNC